MTHWQSSIPLKQIVDEKKVLLVRLYADMPQLTSMVGSMLVSQLLQIALSRSDYDDRPETHLYTDEFELFATRDFSDIISQAGSTT